MGFCEKSTKTGLKNVEKTIIIFVLIALLGWIAALMEGE